ncbi:MAG: site-specific integrase, partial [Candidatus Baltobacteraceae bacterium]
MRGYLRERDRRSPKNRDGAKKTWQLVVDNGVEVIDGIKRRNQVYRSFYGTRRAAESALHDFIEEVKKGVVVRDRKRTLGEYLSDWLEHKRLHLAHKTWAAYEMHVRLHIIPALGTIAISALRKDHIRRAIDEWSRPNASGRQLSQRTIHHVFSTLRTALHDAHEDGLIAVPPFSRRTAPKKGHTEVSALDESQLITLLDYLDATPYGPPTRLAAFTGLRQGELLALRWGAIDLDRRILRVRQSLEMVREGDVRIARFKEPKTERSRREVPLSRMAVEVLRRQRVEQARARLALGAAWGDETLVFPNPATGEPWRTDSFAAGFAKMVARSRLPRVTFHGLRHSFASIQLRAGTPLKVVSDLLGHT